MLVPFTNLPNDSRIWIYQANRPFTEEETEEVENKLREFITRWTAHGSDLQAGYEIPYNRFIVIGLDQSSASATGCSIDASVHFIQELEEKYNIDLLDKMNVTYRNGDYIAHKELKDFKKMVDHRSVNRKTIVFNNLVNNKSEYLEHWEVPADESWHSRFFK